MALAPVDGGTTEGGGTTLAYNLISTTRTNRVNADNSTQPIVQVTAQSQQYLVTYTFFISASTWDTDGGPPLIAERTSWVNEVCAYRHVQAFWTEQDQDSSQLLVNFAVITVGTDDGSITDQTRVRMDHLNDPATFGQIDATWKRLQAAGAS